MNFGFYTVFLKDAKCGELRYGKNTYDYQEGTLVFIGPQRRDLSTERACSSLPS